MENYLTVEREFNPRAVGPLIMEWRSTYEFAKLGLEGILSAVIKDNGDELLHEGPVKSAVDAVRGCHSE